ncbi:MAG: hypothetical protein A3I68_07425 [Candidatus Melainabacteria bacterium RIFCSPLOWO2_02_FULL_35_15]|nr:MAG: hypothetical protein A3F80_09680 [Candidatus Melainabacteria bacterium RIFCSPLOWO2_12_FULL_35_11]OGI13482.1 MAG: hypothetical protein A3I68_07425 [Candidatus Melainabacteria bacterium RIFCSPLOWO2_02_FULL_35_15]
MSNNESKWKYTKKWQIAYVAKKLRQEKKVTLTCLQSETPLIIEMLRSFCNSNPVLRQAICKPNSQEVFLEIVNP